MPVNETHHIELTKNAIRSLRERVIQKDTMGLIASVTNRTLTVKGWTIEEMLVGDGGTSWTVADAMSTEYKMTYSIHLAVSYTRTDDKQPDCEDFKAILHNIYTRAGQPAFGRWVLTWVDEQPYIPIPDAEVKEGEIGYAEADIPEDWSTHFDHLYGLEAHIERIRKALQAGIDSDWSNRFHCALMGPPACGKSDIAGSVRRALGNEAVWVLDGTATTSAGAIQELAEKEILPRVIVIEEIEKADEKTMAFLLGILDLRGEIRKVTARNNIQRETKCFAIVTVNDVDKFDALQAGALSSRFTNRIHFNRPSRDTVIRILAREVAKVNGRVEWIAPAVDYCLEHGIDDPRRIIAFCLCGGDDLLDGSYQKMVDETSPKVTND